MIIWVGTELLQTYVWNTVIEKNEYKVFLLRWP